MTNLNYTIIIPARLQSTRLPNKVMLDINGKPMLQHVIERAQASSAQRIVVTSGDEVILNLAKTLGVEHCYSDPNHKTGTDRINEAATALNLLDDDVVVGLQADEPMLPAELLDQVAQLQLQEKQAVVSTLAKTLEQAEELENPNVVKVVLDHQGYALYFSRAPIPFPRQAMRLQEPLHDMHFFYRHIGLYAYRKDFLSQYVAWQDAAIEDLEQLEQLRILFHGQKIKVDVAQAHPGYGVDTAADLELVRQKIE